MIHPAVMSFDVGNARVGVAFAAANTSVALPLETLYKYNDELLYTEVGELINDYLPQALVVGIPLLLSGNYGAAALMAKEFAQEVHNRFPNITVAIIDERFTSKLAHSKISQAGKKQREHKKMVDQLAASAILDTALETYAKKGLFGVNISVI